MSNIVQHLVLLAVSAALLIASAQAQTFSVLHTFTGAPDGNWPLSGPIFDAKGNLYGTTNNGGSGPCSGGCGAVYEIDAAGKYSVFASMPGGTNALTYPTTSPLPDGKGNLYGGSNSGDLNDGILYKVNKSGAVSEVWAFRAGQDGALPYEDSLTFDAKGVIYGVTAGNPLSTTCTGNGKGFCGSLFKFNPKTGKLTPLHSFGIGKDGVFPGQGLVQDAAGNFYGSTACGAANGLGSIFEFTKAGKYKQLYSFPASKGSCQNGAVGGPWAGGGTMALDSHGTLYGATYSDGANGMGMLFAFNISSRKLKVLRSFTGGSDGSTPNASVLRDAAGNLYGSARYGGTGAAGTVFKLNKSGKFTVLYAFTGGSDGRTPRSLTMDGEGNLDGATGGGGDATCQCGTVFKLTF